jgi:DNA-binding HxlR family transcriptional regulator
MELIGGKWKSVYYLIDAKKDTANCIEIPFMTERTLSLQLKQLELERTDNQKSIHQQTPIKNNM